MLCLSSSIAYGLIRKSRVLNTGTDVHYRFIALDLPTLPLDLVTLRIHLYQLHPFPLQQSLSSPVSRHEYEPEARGIYLGDPSEGLDAEGSLAASVMELPARSLEGLWDKYGDPCLSQHE